jgi:hypothetical protein
MPRRVGLVYYLGTILGAIPSDTPISMVEVKLKELLDQLRAQRRARQRLPDLRQQHRRAGAEHSAALGQGLGTGTQTTVLEDAAKGQGAMPAFIKWWEQTVSDRVLPTTTELQFTDENDMRDQKAVAEVQKLRADTRAVQIGDGEI